MRFLPKYKIFEHVSLSYVKARQREGLKVMGFQTALAMFQHIGKDVLFNGTDTGKLISIDPIQRGEMIRYYGTIERVRGEHTFTSRKLISTLEKI